MAKEFRVLIIGSGKALSTVPGNDTDAFIVGIAGLLVAQGLKKVTHDHHHLRHI